MREAEALSRAHPSGRRQLVVPEGVRVMLRFGLMAQCASTSNACLAKRDYPRPRQFSSDVVAPGHDCSAETPLADPPDVPRGRVQIVSLDLRAREKIKDGRHVGLDFYDLLIEDVELVTEGDVLQFQCDAGAEGRPKNGEESWQDRHRNRIAARRVNSIISSCSEFPVGTPGRRRRKSARDRAIRRPLPESVEEKPPAPGRTAASNDLCVRAPGDGAPA